MNDFQFKNYATCGLAYYVDLQIFIALKQLGHKITVVSKSTDVMFDNIKALK
jgi:hypothetical protein